MTSRSETFIRFSLNERVQHAVLIITMVLLALTGVPQKYSNLSWAAALVNMLGGIDNVRLIHHINALILGVGSIYHLVLGVRSLWQKRGQVDMMPGIKDARDAVANIAYFMGIRKTPPRFERFNYMEKFEYWAVLWGLAVMGLTGLIMWFPVIATSILPGVFVPASKSIHGNEALLAVTVIVVWHLYNTHLNPRVFPFNASIFTGLISKHEMEQDHTLEYERETGESIPDDQLRGHTAQSRFALLTSAIVGVALVLCFATLIAWAIQPPSPTVPSFDNPLRARTSLQQPTAPNLASEPPSTQLWNAGKSPRPVADFNTESIGGTGKLEGQPGVAFRFSDLSLGEITSWLWDFGDGATSTEKNPQHAYQKCPGDKEMCTVTLTICGPGGCDTRVKADHLWVSAKAQKR